MVAWSENTFTVTIRITDTVPQSCFVLKYPNSNILPVFLHFHITAIYINTVLVSLQFSGYKGRYLHNMLIEKA